MHKRSEKTTLSVELKPKTSELLGLLLLAALFTGERRSCVENENWGKSFYLISADRLIHGAFLKYTTGGTELTVFFVKFIQGLCVCVCEPKSVYMHFPCNVC